HAKSKPRPNPRRKSRVAPLTAICPEGQIGPVTYVQLANWAARVIPGGLYFRLETQSGAPAVPGTLAIARRRPDLQPPASALSHDRRWRLRRSFAFAFAYRKRFAGTSGKAQCGKSRQDRADQ